MLKGHATPPSIAGYLPNSALAVEAMMATASIGAVWSSTSPDFGVTVSSSVLIGHVMCLKHILLYIPSFSTAYPTPLLFFLQFCSTLLSDSAPSLSFATPPTHRVFWIGSHRSSLRSSSPWRQCDTTGRCTVTWRNSGM